MTRTLREPQLPVGAGLVGEGGKGALSITQMTGQESLMPRAWVKENKGGQVCNPTGRGLQPWHLTVGMDGRQALLPDNAEVSKKESPG